jgi:DNA-binding NarL/FixJ family response regulator
MSASQSQSKLLIVDDDERVIRHITDVLAEEGHEISFALNRSDAWESITNQELDLVLLDINLPDGNGYEFCRKLKNDGELEHIPVVFITGVADNESIEKAFEAGGEDYVSKPIVNTELRARVKKTLKLSSFRQQLQVKVAERTAELRQKNTRLGEMNASLEETLDRFEKREEQTWETIHDQFMNVVQPHLEKLKTKLSGEYEQALEYAKLIEDNIDEIFLEELDEFVVLREKLTPKEFEVCSFIRKGYTSKEIASTLDRSKSTVKEHRKNIREKLGLKNNDVRLSQYLMDLT